MPDILLVSMPFGPMHLPSLGLSLLGSGLRARGIAARIRYFTLDYAQAIGPDLYQGLSAENPYPADLVGEWVFSEALGRAVDPEIFIEQVIRGGHPDHRKRFAGVLSEAHHHHEAAIGLRPGAAAFVDACVEEILSAKPKVVGFSTVFEQTAASLAAAMRIKARSPETLVVLGGANCEGPMGKALFDQHSYLDAVFSGESDHRFPAAMEAFLGTGRIPVDGGTHARPWLAGDPVEPGAERHMDELPVPDFTDYFHDLRALGLDVPGGSAILFETSRGCWWGEKHHCTFCGLNGEGLGYRSKSPDRALGEFRALRERHPGSPVVVADNILDMGYFKTFLPSLVAEQNGTPLFYEVKANLTRDQLRLLRDAGVATLQPGIESLADGVLRLMDKGVRGMQNLQFLKWCQELGLNAVWNLLHGFPREDPAEYARMIERLPLFHHLTPPMACGPIRLDRFSPNFEQAEERGFSEVHPYPSYRWVFGLDEEEAARMAYYFTYRHADGRDPALYGAPLEAAVNRWRQSHARESLTLLDKGDFLLISDQRAVAPEPLVILEGLEAEVLRACDGVAAFPRLESALPRVPAGDLRDAIAALVERRLLIGEGDLCLALPVKVQPAAKTHVA
ncbi:MAG TPA: RiPP maturation radical SAM C-methyltransferase [Holophagaceae bacterium]|jgi:ribosomal peptide maturation radical SAM protein 1|nr:RiPP maturation radical SAM C-methyltransferase [Holophagaceae bacterium]